MMRTINVMASGKKARREWLALAKKAGKVFAKCQEKNALGAPKEVKK